MTRTRKVAIGVFAVIGVAIAALVAVVALFDWNRAMPMINERVSAAIGRPFAINGDLSVRWAREPDEVDGAAGAVAARERAGYLRRQRALGQGAGFATPRAASSACRRCRC